MKFKTKTKRWGNSLGIVVPKNVVINADLNENASILVIIKKIHTDSLYKFISYNCDCGCKFETSYNNVFCPNCGNTENLTFEISNSIINERRNKQDEHK